MNSGLLKAFFCCAIAALLLCTHGVASAEEDAPAKQPVADIAVEEVIQDQPEDSLQDQVNTANNPLADLVAISLHNYYFPRLNGLPGETANTLWLRFVTPFWRIIPRLSMPIQVIPAPVQDPVTGPYKVTGFGDLNIFATFIATPDDSPAMFGIGPIYTAPTASNDALGHGKHEVGLAALTVWAKRRVSRCNR